jgi:hypothetical protein
MEQWGPVEFILDDHRAILVTLSLRMFLVMFSLCVVAVLCIVVSFFGMVMCCLHRACKKPVDLDEPEPGPGPDEEPIAVDENGQPVVILSRACLRTSVFHTFPQCQAIRNRYTIRARKCRFCMHMHQE